MSELSYTHEREHWRRRRQSIESTLRAIRGSILLDPNRREEQAFIEGELAAIDEIELRYLGGAGTTAEELRHWTRQQWLAESDLARESLPNGDGRQRGLARGRLNMVREVISRIELAHLGRLPN